MMLGAPVNKTVRDSMDLQLIAWLVSPCGMKAWESFRYTRSCVAGGILNVVHRAVVAEVTL